MKSNLIISYDEYIIKFKSLIKSMGLNNSIQREYVLKILFESDAHLSAELILKKVKEKFKVSIGIATVYRVINLLEEMKIINSISLDGSDSKVYELNLVSHHDHLVCIKCNKIVEFLDETIEQLQKDIAASHNFKIQSHNMILYGICKECS